MRASTGMYAAVTEVAGGDALLRALRIPDDFQHRHALLALHVWLILVRLRPEGADGKELAQIFYDTFQDDLEKRVRGAGVKVKVRGQLSELEKQFYGSSKAYDNAMKEEAGSVGESLAAALQRNIFQEAPEREADAARLERYVRRELASLSQTESAAVMAGNIRFSFAAGVQPPP
jgi:cytochrome b pre-mRNA-processing protein 3